jgi:hypothetical protein
LIFITVGKRSAAYGKDDQRYHRLKGETYLALSCLSGSIRRDSLTAGSVLLACGYENSAFFSLFFNIIFMVFVNALHFKPFQPVIRINNINKKRAISTKRERRLLLSFC